MPVCFQLIRKSDPKAGPVALQKIDEEICAHLGVPVDPVQWVNNWYNTIGLGLALGHSFTRIKEIYANPQLSVVCDFLEANFTTDAWREIGWK